MNKLSIVLQRILRFALAKPWLSIVVFFLAFFSSAWYVQYLSFDSSAQSFTKESDPIRQAYIQFEEQYGLSAYFIVLVQDEHLFTPAGIQRLKNLQQELAEQVPHLRSTESIINARYVSSFEDDILIDTFLDEEHLSLELLKEKRELALTTPYFQKRLLSESGDSAAIIVALSQYDENQQRLQNAIKHMSESYAVMREVIERHQTGYEKTLLLGGSPVVGIELTKITMQEMLFFSLLALILVALCLFLLFRRLTAVLYPLFLLSATNVMVLAIMATLGYAVQLSSVILPSFLMAVGVADSVHFLRAFYPVFDATGDKKLAIKKAFEHTSVAMFFTSLTTAVGLLSFANSTVASIANFGVFAAIGVWIAWIITVYCLPAALILSPLKRRSTGDKLVKSRWNWQKLSSLYSAFLYQHRRAIVVCTSLILCVALVLCSQLSFSMDILKWFKTDHSIRHVNQQIEHSMGGVVQLEVLLTRVDGERFELLDLQQLDAWVNAALQQDFDGLKISSAVSVLELLKETHRALLPEKGYELPQSQELFAQELLLLEFEPENLHQFANNDLTELRLTLSLPWVDSLQFNQLSEQLSKNFEQEFQGEINATYTGMLSLTNHTFQSQIHSMVSSYVLAGIVILILLMMLVRSMKLGLAVMLIANVTPIAIVLALMYIFSIPLDVFTLLIGSIAIGIIVDDTIHLLETYRSNLQQFEHPIDAMASAFFTTGKALFFTSIILCLAFLSYSFSSLVPLLNFGYLTALCILLALFADLFVLPALLFCVHPKVERE